MLRQANALGDRASFRDHLVTARQCRNLHTRSHRADLSHQDLQQQSRRTFTRFKKIDVRVGVVRDHGVAVFEHPVGEDSMNVERYDNRDVFTKNSSCFLQQITFRVIFVLGLHRSVQREVDSVYRARLG